MAEKKASLIAKEQGMSAMDLLIALRDAGITVNAASALVDEDRVLEALGLATAAAPEAELEAAPTATATAVADPPTPAPVELTPEPATNGGNGAPVARKRSVGPKILSETPTPPTPSAPQPPAPVTPPTPPAPAPAAPPAAPTPTAPQPPVQRAAPPQAPAPVAAAPAASPPKAAAPEATAPAPEAKASAPAAEAPAPAAPAAEEPTAKKGTAKKDEATPLTPGDKPAPGLGPKILAVPEPPKRPKRDESGNLPGDNPRRPNQGPGTGRTGGTAAGGPGRRRVVIDSQAARRGPGGPGGPGGGPNQPPRRQRRGRRRRGTYDDTVRPLDVGAQTATDLVQVNSGSTVKAVAEYLGVPVPDVIRQLMSLGQMATLTQTLSDDAIQVIADHFEKTIEIVHLGDDADTVPTFDDDAADLVTRPPVVTIMGHVDHGKTSLLDAVREADVVGGEAGGITQHIGAYQVHTGDEKTVTFLDTPGHEAFTAMRARGAQVTDIVVIVVAADDGVRPQTREAIDHAMAADVPMLVAVNKIDKEGADPTRVRTEMTNLGLQPAEWGGDTEFVDVSAKTKVGLEDLLETIQVVADLEDLKANPDAPASGYVVESKLDPGRGPVVTMLVQRGTLKVGDAVVAGATWGKVRALTNYVGKRQKTAAPGDPVEILGFDGVPVAGEFAQVVTNERVARTQAAERETRQKAEALARRSGRKVSLEDVFKRQQAAEYKELNLIVKADVAGSVEAIEDEIAKLPQDEVQVMIISSGVGGITESDVMLAAASEAIILGFNVRPVGDARAAADREGVEIRNYSVIYRALEEIRDAMSGMLEPEEVEDTVGQVEVRQIFRASKIGLIAGCYVTDGKVTRGGRVRIIRDGTVLGESTVAGLRRFNDDVREVATGFECGITLDRFQDLREGDVFEVYETRKVERTLA